MDLNYYKQLLTNKERQLEDDIGRTRSDANDSQTADVQDPIDYVTSSQGQMAALEEGSRLTDQLEAVRAALQRIESSEYGRCLDCARQIEEARLKAVPWTLYCKEDQEKHDAAASSTVQADIS